MNTVTWLKIEHGFGHKYASLPAHDVLHPRADALGSLFAGTKAVWRDVYDALIV